MSGFGSHAGYIAAAYLAVLIVIGGLVLAILLDHRRQKRALAALEDRGAGRGRKRP